MFKKFFITAITLFIANTAFAVDRNELNVEFFSKFNDDNLVCYINEAINNNHTAKQAASRVEQYREQVKYSFGKELPSFSVSANYLGIKVPQLDNFSLKKNAFVLPFVANYEADFLLKNRDKTKSQKKVYEISKYDEKSVYISLLSDVATVYTNILQYDKLIRISEEQVLIKTNLLTSDEKKFNQGTINSVQLNNSKKNLETAKSDLENLKKQQEILLMQLAVLTGISPLEANSLQRGSLDEIEYKEEIPTEIQSDIIFARPDVLAAEAELEKAKIDVRIARKEFLPTFNITGVWIFNTIAPGTFFSWDSSLASLIAGASQDIFTGGRKIANLKIQKAKYEELFEKYNQTNLEAVKEVNTALCLMKHDLNTDKNTINKLDYEIKNLKSSKTKLNQGVTAKTEYLITLSETLQLQQEATNTKTQRIINYFTLYKAVGGKL